MKKRIELIFALLPWVLILASLLEIIPIDTAFPAFSIGVIWLCIRLFHWIARNVFSRKDTTQYRVIRSKAVRDADGKVTIYHLVEPKDGK